MDFRGKGDRMEAEEIAALQKANEELTAKLAEAGKGGGDEIGKELERLRAEKAELIAGRDKAKEKARLAEEAKLTENSEFKTLAEQLKAERAELLAQNEEHAATLNIYKERDEAELAKLLESVPESLRGTVSNDSIPLAQQLVLARELSTMKPGGPGARPPGQLESNEISRADFDSKTAVEKSKFCIGGGTIKD